MMLMACGVTHDTELTPRWDDGPTELWTAEVQDVIDSWQAVLGDDCTFPLFVGPNGPQVALVAASKWPYHGTLGLYDPDNGNVYVLGNGPRRDGTTSTLGHELGHAAGLGHSMDKHSIMFAGDGLTTVPADVDGAELRSLLGCAKR